MTSGPTRIAVFLPTWVGDMAMATPALRALCSGLPGCELVGVCRGVAGDVLAGTPWLHSLVDYKRNWFGKGSRGQCVRKLRSLHCDTAILLSNSLTTALMARLAGCRRRIGFARHGRSWLLTDRLQAPRDRTGFVARSAVEHYLETLAPLDVSGDDPTLELRLSHREQELGQRLWDARGLGRHNQIVVLNIGGAYGSAKRWPDEKFARLAQRLAVELQVGVIVNCGPAERTAAAAIATMAAHPSVSSLADAPICIGLTKAVISRADLLISTDSGPRHLGAGFQTPTIALFGPTDPRWSENGNPLEVKLQLDLPCSPCGKRTCPYGHHDCMQKLAVERVFAQAKAMLKGSQSRAVRRPDSSESRPLSPLWEHA